MRIEWMKIKGFRNFVDEIINFSDKTLIIGANDVGKTNMIYAMRLLLDRNLSLNDLDLSEYDYNAYSSADEIEITLKLVEIQEDCLLSVFGGDIKDNTTYIQYKNSKSSDVQILSGPTEELLEEKSSRFYLKRLNLEYVDTNRDLFKFINKERKRLFLYAKEARLAKEIIADENSVRVIKKHLDAVNKNINKLNYIKKSLSQVNEELCGLAIHNNDQEVCFVSSSSDMSELENNLDISYNDGVNALKIGGDGRNNQIFLSTWIAKQKIESSLEKVTLFAIEEPEAHLHPHQQRKLSKYLVESFDKQVFITTHSPHIASEFNPSGIVRLFSKNKITKIAQKGCSKHVKLLFDEFGYRLNVISAEIFFSSGVFLVEGTSEVIFYKALAKSLNLDLDWYNISILSVEGIGFKPYIKVCQVLDIPYVIRTDNDIFTKKKNGVEYNYFAGITRTMGIYNDLISTGADDDLTKYWMENKKNIVWEASFNDIPETAIQLNKNICNELKEFNLFMANDNLELDLVNSELSSSLKKFYNKKSIKTLFKAMQSRKAENMMSYVTSEWKKLKILKDGDIVKPLAILIGISERMVKYDG